MRRQYLELGQIVGTHGVRGEIRVQPWCEVPVFFSNFTPYILAGRARELPASFPAAHMAT